MKNLKDYFSSPRTPEDGTVTTSPILEKSACEDDNNAKKSKKKRRKDSSTVVSVNEGDEEEEYLPRKKRVTKRKAAEDDLEGSIEKKQKTNSKRKSSRKSRASAVSKTVTEVPADSPQNIVVEIDNGTDVSENEIPLVGQQEISKEEKDLGGSVVEKNEGKSRRSTETVTSQSSKEADSRNGAENENKGKEASESSPSESKKNLLNFFKKVEKTFPVKEDIKKMTVECLVHTPPKEKQAKRLSRLSSGENSPIGDNVKASINRRWQMRISLNGSVSNADSSTSLSDDDIVVLDEVNKPKKKDSKKSLSTKRKDANAIITVDSSSDTGSIISQESSNLSSKSQELSNLSSKSSQERELTSKNSQESSNSDVILVDDDCSSVAEEGRKLRPKLKSGVILDDDDSSSVAEEGRKLRPKKSAVVIVDDDSCAAEDVKNVRPKLKSGNLAAYFGLKEPDNGKKPPKLTPEQSLARNQFLQSPAPESIRKLITKAVVENTGVEAPFPKHSHTRQMDKFNIIWSLDKLPVQLDKLKPNFQDTVTIPEWSSLTCQPPPLLDPPPPPKIHDQEDFPLAAWKRGLKNLKNLNKNAYLWTDKYCPSTCSEVTLNGYTVDKLSEWLAAASTRDAGSDSESSGDDFEDGKDSGARRAGNTALLIGPPGCGKTAAVYAAAKHNQYQVLELNASCNRNGKKIVAEFSEATQSHKVETKSLLKVKKSRSKKKKAETNMNKSLILIEDADIVLDGVDEGYASGLASLQAGSKRPLLLVVNSYQSAKHIHKLPVSITFNMDQPKPSCLSKYLTTMASIEKLKVDENCIESIIDVTKCDLRRSILALQLGCPPVSDENIIRLRLSALGTDEQMDKSNAGSIVRTSHALAVLDTLTSSCQQWTSDYCSVDGQDNQPCCYEGGDSLLGEISSVLLALCTKNSSVATPQEYDSVRSWRTKYENHIGEGTASAQCVSRRAISSDYMASVREIARAESIKTETLSRRSARLLSHLSYANLPTEGEDIAKLVSSLAPPEITQKEIAEKT